MDVVEAVDGMLTRGINSPQHLMVKFITGYGSDTKVSGNDTSTGSRLNWRTLVIGKVATFQVFHYVIQCLRIASSRILSASS